MTRPLDVCFATWATARRSAMRAAFKSVMDEAGRVPRPDTVLAFQHRDLAIGSRLPGRVTW